MSQDHLRRFGLIALATDLTIEGDAGRLMPAGTQLHVTRIAFENPTTPETLRRTGPRVAVREEIKGRDRPGAVAGCTVLVHEGSDVFGERDAGQPLGVLPRGGRAGGDRTQGEDDRGPTGQTDRKP